MKLGTGTNLGVHKVPAIPRCEWSVYQNDVIRKTQRSSSTPTIDAAWDILAKLSYIVDDNYIPAYMCSFFLACQQKSKTWIDLTILRTPGRCNETEV